MEQCPRNISSNRIRGFEPVIYDKIKNTPFHAMPVRGTKYSAGYDFPLMKETLFPSKSVTIVWTNVKAYMLVNEYLAILPRSSVGIKKGLTLANTVGVIDMDYYSNPDNDGNIGIAIYNRNDHDVIIVAGENIAQGIFKPFLESDNCNTDDIRVGGIGSTSK